MFAKVPDQDKIQPWASYSEKPLHDLIEESPDGFETYKKYIPFVVLTEDTIPNLPNGNATEVWVQELYSDVLADLHQTEVEQKTKKPKRRKSIYKKKDKLTNRQKECIEMFSRGMSKEDIAAELGIGVPAVTKLRDRAEEILVAAGEWEPWFTSLEPQNPRSIDLSKAKKYHDNMPDHANDPD